MTKTIRKSFSNHFEPVMKIIWKTSSIHLLLVSYNFTSEIYFSFLIDLVIDCGQIVVKLCYLFILLFIEFYLVAKFNSFSWTNFLCSNIVGKNHLAYFLGRLSLSDSSMIFYIKISSITVKRTDGRCYNFCTFWFLILQFQVHKCLVLQLH